MDAEQFRTEIESIEPSLFVSCSSFEERCLASSKIVAAASFCLPLIFRTNRISEKSSLVHKELMDANWKREPCSAEISIADPLVTVDVMTKSFRALPEEAMRSIVVDISTFTHEHLAILLKLLHSLNLLQVTHFAYVSVCAYGGTEATEHLWLSRGTANIRPIVGFPGMLRPSRPLHLIALVGFEFERARVAIEEAEPNYVSLGVGERCESVTTGLHGKNQEFYSRLMDFVDERLTTASSTRQFEFSCIFPEKTKKQILDLIASIEERNVVLFPMNTKISTLGAVMAALENPSIQLGYVEPLEYNVAEYSQGVDGFRLFRGSDFFDSKESVTLLTQNFS